ncbi:MAG: tRNA1(Val) (adenine(37)-N6)-methyltransferase [Clostridiales bacterium]|jgi:tRNA1Val (adenine37-N6)-methyltransferase|nr:tRNA1(Val) (adenine(37)-N6)-methyltransferase [Clostridiales bacterium]
MSEALLKAGERLDDLHRNNFRIIQNPAYFTFGMDAVLLSSFAAVHKNETHMDLCSGNGIIPILLAAKNRGISYGGVEINEKLADMAVRSVALNGLEDKIRIHNADIRALGGFGANFDVVTANPPYMAGGTGAKNESYDRAIARHEILCNLEDVASAAAKLLRFGGRFYMVHRPGRLADIVVALRKYGLEPKTLRLVQPKAGAAPNMLLIAAAKGGKPHMDIKPPLVVYDDAGQYTKEIYEIYYE